MSEMTTTRGGGYSTRDLLVVAVLAAISGVVNVFVVFPFAKLVEGIGPFGLPLNTFLFVFWGSIAAFITGKPLAALMWSLLDGVVEMLVGSGSGSILLLFVLFQGLGLELGLALNGYKPSFRSAATGGALACVAFMIAFLYVFGFAEHPIGTQIGLLAAEAVVGWFGVGWLGYGIYKALQRTGAISQLRADRSFQVLEE